MPLDKLTIPIVEIISYPPRIRLSLFYHKRLDRAMWDVIRILLNQESSKKATASAVAFRFSNL